MEISGLISETSIIELSGAEGRERVFAEMVDYLVQQGSLPTDLRESVLKNLEEREAKISTSIGDGIGLPHASIQGLPEVLALLAKVDESIDSQSTDGKPIKIFFMILVPFDKYSIHLRTLATVARFLNQPEIKSKLNEAGNKKDLFQIIQSQKFLTSSA
ncbi:MAG: PTS sugar transporter subunit IIA [Verrucomicrobiota bacterium]